MQKDEPVHNVVCETVSLAKVIRGMISLGIAQEVIAMQAKVSQSTVSRILNNKITDVRFRTAYSICKVWQQINK